MLSDSINCRLSKHEDNEHNNGYGFVEFSSSEECKKAIQHCKNETFNDIRLTGELLLSMMVSNDDNVKSIIYGIIIIEFHIS